MSVVDATLRYQVQNGMVERNAGLPPERRIDFRVGIHFGDIVEEADGDLINEGANMATRLAEQARDAGRRSPHVTLSGGSVLLVIPDAAA